MKANHDIRNHADKMNVRLWEVARNVGIGESTLIRRLRVELPESEKPAYIDAINRIAADKAKEKAATV